MAATPYLDDANRAVTHVNGTSSRVNRPGNMNHACSSRSAMIHIRWDRTAAGPRELCGLGGSVVDLLDGAEDHRRGALDGPAPRCPGP